MTVTLTMRDRMVARAVERYIADHIKQQVTNVLGRMPSIQDVDDAAVRGILDAGTFLDPADRQAIETHWIAKCRELILAAVQEERDSPRAYTPEQIADRVLGN